MENVIEINSLNHLQQLIKDNTKLIIDFWADSCEPCKEFMPTYEKYASIYESLIGFTKVNVDDVEEIEDYFDISIYPTFFFYKEGKIWKAKSIAFKEKDFAIILDEFLKV